MKKILLVDDDALVLELYRKKLARGGFEVRTAADGLEAIKALGGFRPDLVVLDLLMPKMSGTDVLKFIRTKPALAKLPVVAFTNAFMSEQARLVNSLGVARAVVKGDFTPNQMLALAVELLQAAPDPAVESASAAAQAPAPVPEAESASVSPEAAREKFLARVPEDFTDLQSVSREFAQDPAAAGRSGTLPEFCRQMHQLAVAAALARCQYVALMSGALEAMLYELGDKPQFLNPSTSRTIASGVEFLGSLIENARTGRRAEALVGEVLVVDDDPLANRIALAALSRAKLTAVAVESPVAALELLTQKRFDLFLFDVEMPQLNGYELCRKLRAMDGYERTPVIYVTSHSDFENHAKSILAGGNDLIAKPIFPIELAVKAVMHLIRGKLATLIPAGS
jgi:CheY-like chemotaxis protein